MIAEVVTNERMERSDDVPDCVRKGRKVTFQAAKAYANSLPIERANLSSSGFRCIRGVCIGPCRGCPLGCACYMPIYNCQSEWCLLGLPCCCCEREGNLWVAKASAHKDDNSIFLIPVDDERGTLACFPGGHPAHPGEAACYCKKC